MAIADRLNKLRTDIEDTYQAINEIGGTIPSDKNTNNIPEAIRSVYSNLPKVSDTGTNVSLSPTLKGRLGIVPKGNTLQNGTPTPDAPVEIQSATGTQKVVVSGKNLNQYPYKETTKTTNGITFTDNGNGTILVDGTNSGSGTVYFNMTDTRSEKPITLKAGTYTVSLGSSSNVRATIAKYSDATSVVAVIPVNTSTKTFTITEETDVTFALAVNSGLSVSNVLITPMLNEGTTATPYQPYQEPQEVDIELGNIELNKIGTYEDYIDGTPDNWVLYKKTRKISLNISDMNNAEDYPGWKNVQYIKNDYPNNNNPLNYLCDYKSNINISTNEGIGINTNSNNATLQLRKAVFNLTQTQWKEQYPNLTFKLVYGLQEYEQTPITDTNLVSQLNELYYLQSYNDTTNIDVTGNLPMRITASAIKGA